jgi:hypothetical protein
MVSDNGEIAYILGRMRMSREMAAKAFDRRAALAHEQMNYCYLVRLAELKRPRSPVHLEDGRYRVLSEAKVSPMFHRAGRGLMLVAG